MLIEQMERLNDNEFRRKTGVKRETFFEMVKEVKEAKKARPTRRGKESQFSVEDQVLVLLKYDREYVTYLSIAAELYTSESNICRMVKKTEEILVQSAKFRLPGKKALRSDMAFEGMVVDATETKVDRPKKRESGGTSRFGTEKTSKHDFIRGRRNTTT